MDCTIGGLRRRAEYRIQEQRMADTSAGLLVCTEVAQKTWYLFVSKKDQMSSFSDLQDPVGSSRRAGFGRVQQRIGEHEGSRDSCSRMQNAEVFAVCGGVGKSWVFRKRSETLRQLAMQPFPVFFCFYFFHPKSC